VKSNGDTNDDTNNTEEVLEPSSIIHIGEDTASNLHPHVTTGECISKHNNCGNDLSDIGSQCSTTICEAEKLVSNTVEKKQQFGCGLCNGCFALDKQHLVHTEGADARINLCMTCNARLSCGARDAVDSATSTPAYCFIIKNRQEAGQLTAEDASVASNVVDRDGVDTHLESEQSNESGALSNPFNCSACGLRFKDQSGLQRHKELHASGKPCSRRKLPVLIVLKCKHCDTIIQSCNTQDENGHTNISTPEVLQCPKCCTSEMSHVFKCHLCDRVYRWRSGLRIHMRWHFQKCNGTQPQQKSKLCPQCGKLFGLATNLQRHLLTVHKQENTSAARSSGGQGHQHGQNRVGARRLNETGKFLCNICGHTFVNANLLKIHLRRHAGIKPYQCTSCSKAFITVTERNKHIAYKHSSDHLSNQTQQYSCRHCGKPLRSRQALNTHTRIQHSQPGVNYPFVCSICSRGFLAASTLNKHMPAHSAGGNSKRKAMCAICKMLFRHVTVLGRHISIVHSDAEVATPFACAVCSEEFENAIGFKKHYKSKHRNR
jgi:KRAB domain-containing zinc finger protein